MKIDRSLVDLFEKLDSGDFSCLSDLSDAEESDDELLDAARNVEDKLLSQIRSSEIDSPARAESYHSPSESDDDDQNYEEINQQYDQESENRNEPEEAEDIMTRNAYQRTVEADGLVITDKKKIKWSRRQLLEPKIGTWELSINKNDTSGD